MRYSALRALQQQRGGRFSEISGWETASHFGDPIAEHLAVRSGTGLIDLSLRAKVLVTGRDRAQFLHGMLTNEVKALCDGQGNHAAMVTAQGQTLADMRVYCQADSFILEMEPELGPKVMTALDRYLISEDARLADVTEAFALVSLSGLRSPFIIQACLGLDVAGLPVYGSARSGGVVVARVDVTGEMGFLIFMPSEDAERICTEILEVEPVRLVGLEAFRSLRMEAGLPVYGQDIEESATPIEAGLTGAVSFNKGCYIGQEVIAKMTFRGKPRRHLVGIAVEGDRIPSPRDGLARDGANIGHITSAMWSPSTGKVIAFGYVKRDMNRPGGRLEIKSGEGVLQGEVVEVPFYRANG